MLVQKLIHYSLSIFMDLVDTHLLRVSKQGFDQTEAPYPHKSPSLKNDKGFLFNKIFLSTIFFNFNLKISFYVINQQKSLQRNAALRQTDW